MALLGMASMTSLVLAQEPAEKKDEPAPVEVPDVPVPADPLPDPGNTEVPEVVDPADIKKATDAPLPVPGRPADSTPLLPIPDAPLPTNPAVVPNQPVAPISTAAPKKTDIITKRLNSDGSFTNLNLTGLTLIPDSRKLVSQAKINADSFAHGSGVSFTHLQAKQVPIPKPGVLKRKLSSYVGKPLTFKELEDIVILTQKHYVENGYPLIHVFIPGQAVSAKVKVAVRVGRITKATVSADEAKNKSAWASWYDEPYDLADLEEEVNKKISVVGDLQPTQLGPILAEANSSPWARLNRIQQHPFLKVAGKLKPRKAGTDPNSKQYVLGETEVELVAQQERPLKFFLGYDNSLTELLGEDRFYLGGVWYDAFGLGLDHQLAIQAFSATDSSALLGVAGSYQIPWKGVGQHTEFFAAYVESEAEVSTAGIGTDIGGSSLILGVRHFFELPPLAAGGEIIPGNPGFDPGSEGVPLFSTGKKTRQKFGVFHEVGIGFDFKQTDNTLEFGGTTVSDDTANLSQVVLAYNARQTDPNGETNLTFENFFGVGGDDDEFERLRTGAETGYYYARAKLEREQDLPAGMLLKARLVGQFASENLLQSEQLGFGGYNSVRGYAERAYRADSGLFFSAEIYSPPMHPLAHFWGKKGLQDELRFLAFFDYGTGEASDELIATDVSQTLMSAGFGFRYSVGNDFQLRFDWGFPLEDLDSPPFPEEASDSRAHLGAVWTF